MPTSTQEALRQFVSETLLSGRHTVEVDDDLLGYEMIDSMGMMWLVNFLEQDFHVRIPPEDITIEHFRTIRTIDAYLQRRLA